MERHTARTPSPNPQGWSSPGFPSPRHGGPSSRATTPKAYTSTSSHEVTWASAQARSAQVNGGSRSPNPGSGPFGLGLIAKATRKVSDSLPLFWGKDEDDRFAVKEKEKWVAPARGGRGVGVWLNNATRGLKRLRLRGLLLAVVALVLFIIFHSPLQHWYRRTSWLGGGKKYVVILAANLGGGVMEWKGPREWAIERDSIRNKRKYVAKWGYDLEIVDMSTKKRYAHEWRESWEKVDTIRNAMRKYPKAEWFWWLDLNTFIMEPSYSLQSHIFNHLDKNTYRDINHYNPLNITHPPEGDYLDPDALSPVGDGKKSSINIVIPQDCSGFNLGSFLVRRSAWTDRLMDIWWDPVGYEQKHMEWEHKEQDALEYLYRNQPWVRTKFAFISQRRINSFPPGACGEKGGNPRIHYHEKDRDFLVNMAGCEWGRDCWGEMYTYRELSNYLNRNLWQRLTDGYRDFWKYTAKGKKKPPYTGAGVN
ncbi:glycosyltransferase family 34 protein [Myriangium duriaei CBS 260.36]|uniref:Glycosyltransferase family 34 protein n=1 Tax=Myriangium duriaei CBS 260.36 TaxID=1168546 RepID=A0A9P4IZ90_9PEZI|nr:glycosyltransferase family 34 protein [Myriangium duriaei CBS 260.36]